MNVTQILFVSDNYIDSQLASSPLYDEFAVTQAANVTVAIELVKSQTCTPAVILMALNVPNVEKFKACQQLLDIVDNNADVIFLSQNSSLDEKIKAYDAGGSDYIAAPLDVSELLAKIRLAIKRHKDRSDLQMQANGAMETAMTAIMDAGEQASVLHFMRDSFSCEDETALAELIVEACEGFELSSTVQIHLPQQLINRSNHAHISSLEISMLQAISASSIRIYQQGKRLMLNFGCISLLIKNLPIDDENKCGRIRDNVALILEGASSRLAGLIAKSEKQALIAQTQDAVEKIHQAQAAYKNKSLQIVDELVEDIRISFLNYGLTEEQENALLGIIEKYSEQMMSSYEKGLKLDEKLEKVNDKLSHALQNTL